MDSAVVAAVEVARCAHGWDRETAERVGVEYLRFVELAELHPRVALVPAADVDLVWHEHLLTAGEERGLRPPAHGTHSTPDHRERFARTLGLYRARFGEPPAEWSVAAACQIDEPAPEPVAPPEEPPARRRS